ncbi:MAG TPA: response regulator, partial [Verrucomicrobia bacterium]|nr:response regulator [Verrucomicrobiota bacterium]
FNYSREEIVGQSILKLLPEEEHQEYRTRAANSLLSEQARISETGREIRGLRKTNEIIPIDLVVSQMHFETRRFVICVVRDITDQKHLEDQFRQSQKMEAIGRLAGGIAHDFNNLLQVILGYCRLLLGKSPSIEVYRQKIEEIEGAAESAASLTGQLLAFSRKQVLQPTDLDLNDVVHDMNKMVKLLITEKISCETHLKAENGHVRADRGQIEQVIVNLAVNARDAMPNGGEISLETENLIVNDSNQHTFPELNPAEFILLRISDSGCGIPPDTLAQIFDPFFTTKDIGKGTGLGLSTVYGIIKQTGGHILVKSEVAHGTSFEIYLPISEKRIQPATTFRTEPSREIPMGTETILLVEDESIVRMMLQEVLSDQGYEVIEAENGKHALSVYEGFIGSVDMLITDLIMPEMNGRELAAALSTIQPDLKVIYLSGYTEDDVVRLGPLNTSDGFLQKPFRSEALLEKVSKILNPTTDEAEPS